MSQEPIQGSSPEGFKPGDTQPNKPVKKAPRWRSVLFSVLGVIALLALGTLGGYTSGIAQRQAARKETISRQLTEQFEFALVDEQFGRYDAARQRLEFIIQNNPSFPGAQDELAKVLVMLSVPTPPPTVAPTATPDTRGVEALFESAKQLIAAGDWANAITALDQLRKQDPNRNTSQVDGMYYFALRNYGVSIIQNQGDLEGGIYQLTLAERFAPLDNTASGLREGARAYLQAVSYFGVNWQTAVDLFRNVAAGWPAMWDGNMNAGQRFRIALMRYGDTLWARGDACGAAEIFDEALTFGALDDTSGKNSNLAHEACLGPTIPTEEPTNQPKKPTKTPGSEPTAEPPTEEPPTAEPTASP